MSRRAPARRSQLDGHDAIWTGDWAVDPGDEVILDFAQRESRILITLDKDVGELAVVFGRPHCGIVRLVDIDPARQISLCQAVLARYGEQLLASAIVTVTSDRVRVRPQES
ncbi:MAG TPA: DUF5615 family PIN-like protein [Burkholderiales bacterium]|nr:DUF5615 family PIN-like protein [Burkholderiales bacterium]